jgi:hypothetical protein
MPSPLWLVLPASRGRFFIGVLAVCAGLIAVVLGLVDFRRSYPSRQRLAAENSARAAEIRARYSVTISGDVVTSRGGDGFEQSVRWSEVDEILSGYETIRSERLLGWILRSANGECFVPDDAHGSKALGDAIYSLPTYFEQASVRTPRATSLWRRADPYPKQPANDSDDL